MSQTLPEHCKMGCCKCCGSFRALQIANGRSPERCKCNADEPTNAVLRSTRPLVSKVGTNAVRSVGARNVSAMSTPSLINIEKRWDTMSSEEREDIISQLAERQKGPWKELTPEEKKAAWYISYGAWGPRKPIHAAGDAKKIWLGVFGALGGAFVLLNLSKYIFGHESRTMNKEWQEASNEILKENKANPFSGYDQVQSSSGGPKVDDEE